MAALPLRWVPLCPSWALLPCCAVLSWGTALVLHVLLLHTRCGKGWGQGCSTVWCSHPKTTLMWFGGEHLPCVWKPPFSSSRFPGPLSTVTRRHVNFRHYQNRPKYAEISLCCGCTLLFQSATCKCGVKGTRGESRASSLCRLCSPEAPGCMVLGDDLLFDIFWLFQVKNALMVTNASFTTRRGCIKLSCQLLMSSEPEQKCPWTWGRRRRCATALHIGLVESLCLTTLSQKCHREPAGAWGPLAMQHGPQAATTQGQLMPGPSAPTLAWSWTGNHQKPTESNPLSETWQHSPSVTRCTLEPDRRAPHRTERCLTARIAVVAWGTTPSCHATTTAWTAPAYQGAPSSTQCFHLLQAGTWSTAGPRSAGLMGLSLAQPWRHSSSSTSLHLLWCLWLSHCRCTESSPSAVSLANPFCWMPAAGLTSSRKPLLSPMLITVITGHPMLQDLLLPSKQVSTGSCALFSPVPKWIESWHCTLRSRISLAWHYWFKDIETCDASRLNLSHQVQSCYSQVYLSVIKGLYELSYSCSSSIHVGVVHRALSQGSRCGSQQYNLVYSTWEWVGGLGFNNWAASMWTSHVFNVLMCCLNISKEPFSMGPIKGLLIRLITTSLLS